MTQSTIQQIVKHPPMVKENEKKIIIIYLVNVNDIF